jgi:phosphoribosylaminoimidazolecarboxamide formyltransferase/IMP cyclohydrolase
MAINKVETIDDRVRVTTVLVSVSDKTGLDLLIRGLIAANSDLRILSTGGSHAAIGKILGDSASRWLQQVSDYTGQPEMQGGLVKTLDFKVYLGLLSETHNPAHQTDLARAGAVAIDMVIVNLYPFRETIAKSGASLEDARGNIDIGGPCMVRAAAKNFHRVAALTDPADYTGIVKEISESGGTLGLATRFRLAQKAFTLTAGYDHAIAGYLSGIRADKVTAPYHVMAGG